MKRHPTSLRVIFADSVSNQERSPYPPPSRPRPPAAATAAAKSAPAAGVIGARMIGCSMSKNFINRVLIITIPLWFAAIQLPLFRYNVADAALCPVRRLNTALLPRGVACKAREMRFEARRGEIHECADLRNRKPTLWGNEV